MGVVDEANFGDLSIKINVEDDRNEKTEQRIIVINYWMFLRFFQFFFFGKFDCNLIQMLASTTVGDKICN